MPRGIANNNPLNLRENHQVDYDWVGEHPEDLDPSFEEFTTAFYGIRAAARTLKTYRDKHGLNTVRGIVYRWAPPSDNNPTEKYIQFVAAKAGVSENQALADSDYPHVVAAMIHFENGYNPYDRTEIITAVAAGLE
ncbi:virion protein [Shewanella sp. WXL01]|nr:virion protein [Shewanella sp. WXL01]